MTLCLDHSPLNNDTEVNFALSLPYVHIVTGVSAGCRSYLSNINSIQDTETLFSLRYVTLAITITITQAIDHRSY